ncbi:uncharacterized protein LOC108217910 isoform X2 [Daucus carota subsp. sativus]|uniref:uncharacterized protein LOC108217910 isoform X2 n=1 Tax=Daucus carota subsp. sativus TaxID=79200 RepID=UPI0007EF62F7|nr:PREDICTED: uncharacterized protein LOC108217910 isoform X3 [Daucus carota subsp. sativus]
MSSQNLQKNKYQADDDIEYSIVQDPEFSDEFGSDYLVGYSSTDENYNPSMDVESESDVVEQRQLKASKVIPKEYVSLGSPECICSKCNARLWKVERTNKNVTKGILLFSICCKKGDLRLPPTPPTPEYLLQLYNNKETAADFQRSIWLYNIMFSFTSTGGNVDNSIHNGRGPYIYRLNGQNHHVFR